MLETKKGKLHVNVQVYGTEQVCTLWPMKFFPKAGLNLFSLMCELLHGNEIVCDHQNNIVVESSKGVIISDFWIKTHGGWVAGVKFLHETNQEKAQSTTSLHKKNINDLHIELGNPSKVITNATTKLMGIQVTNTFKLFEDCALGKANKSRVCKKAVACSKILEERLFFVISSPSTSTFGGKKHWLLVIEDSTDYVWSYFSKEKMYLASVWWN